MRSPSKSRLIALVRGQWAGLLALFLVIAGGTAYAADTIGSSDIINGQVKSVDIGNNQVQGVDAKDGSLTGTDITDNTLGPEDIAAGAVQSAELGIGAITGHMDDPIVVSSASNTTTSKEVQVPCNFSSDEVTGGGFVIAGPGGSNVPNVAIQRSYAVNDHTWLVRAVATSGTPEWQLTGVATCAF